MTPDDLIAAGLRNKLRTLYHIDTTGMTSAEVIAKHHEVMTPRGDEPTAEDILEWLKQQGPAEWHRSAATWNWDNPMDAMSWVLSQPDCDAGTAIMLFALGEPSYYSKFSSMDELEAKAGYMMETVRFMIDICERWEAGQYKTYRFKPTWTTCIEPGSLPWAVPESLGMAEARGEELDLTGWGEGMPPEMIDLSWRRT